MIYNNYVSDGSIITSAVWNKAWGFEGTAKSLYDSIGAQQYHNNIYSAFSWSTATQSITANAETVQFSFLVGTTYPSSEKSGNLNNWKTGMITAGDFRDRITIQRSGYYLIQAEFSINDSSNRVCSSTNTDGCTTVPDNSMYLYIYENNGLSPYKTHVVRPNSVKAATYNATENVAPHVSAVVTYFKYYKNGEYISLKTSAVDAGVRNERITNAAFKAFLVKAD